MEQLPSRIFDMPEKKVLAILEDLTLMIKGSSSEKTHAMFAHTNWSYLITWPYPTIGGSRKCNSIMCLEEKRTINIW